MSHPSIKVIWKVLWILHSNLTFLALSRSTARRSFSSLTFFNWSSHFWSSAPSPSDLILSISSVTTATWPANRFSCKQTCTLKRTYMYSPMINLMIWYMLGSFGFFFFLHKVNVDSKWRCKFKSFCSFKIKTINS